MPHGMIWEIAAGSFGIAAAILLVGGWVLLRYQRDRQHFLLLQAALERGITALPGAVAAWVISLRQGVLSLVLGLGLAAGGFALHATAGSIEQLPPDAAASPSSTMPNESPDRRPFQPPADRMNQGPRDNGPPGGPPDGPRMHEGPHSGPPDAPPSPPHLNPAMERWQRIQSQRLTGLIAICAGGILALLGIVRIAFASLEKKYALEAPASPTIIK